MILFILIGILSFIFISLFIKTFKKKKESFETSYNGACVFDIDGTILQGLDNKCVYNGKTYDHTNGGCTAAAIQACKDKNYLLAVNTASYRGRDKFCEEVGLSKNGVCMVEEKNWWNSPKYIEAEPLHLFQHCGINHGGCGKACIMKKIQKENNIKNKKNVVLWDDYYPNITACYSAGFGVIPTNNLLDCTDIIGEEGVTQRQIDDFVKGNTKLKKYCKDFKFKKCHYKKL